MPRKTMISFNELGPYDEHNSYYIHHNNVAVLFIRY